jgi:hypothetical protein
VNQTHEHKGEFDEGKFLFLVSDDPLLGNVTELDGIIPYISR